MRGRALNTSVANITQKEQSLSDVPGTRRWVPSYSTPALQEYECVSLGLPCRPALLPGEERVGVGEEAERGIRVYPKLLNITHRQREGELMSFLSQSYRTEAQTSHTG